MITDRILARPEDGYSQIIRESDTEGGRRELARRQAEGEPDALEQIAALDKRVAALAAELTLQMDGLKMAVRTILEEDVDAPLAALTERVAAVEADLVGMTARLTSVEESVAKLLPPVPLPANASAP